MHDSRRALATTLPLHAFYALLELLLNNLQVHIKAFTLLYRS